MTRKPQNGFWLGCFPHHFKSEIGVDDANCFGARLDYADDLIEGMSNDSSTTQASKCIVTIDRIGTAGIGNSCQKAEKAFENSAWGNLAGKAVRLRRFYLGGLNRPG